MQQASGASGATKSDESSCLESNNAFKIHERCQTCELLAKILRTWKNY